MSLKGKIQYTHFVHCQCQPPPADFYPGCAYGVAEGALLARGGAEPATGDRLPSWNEGPAKQSIVDFVAAVTREARRISFRAERIATFDNDGTLWVEHPMYTQLAFALDRVKALAPQHPEWKTKQPFKAVLEGDMKTLAGIGREGPRRDDHGHPCRHDDRGIRRRSSRTGSPRRAHPRFKRPYTELVYQPMLELLAYLRANGFKTFIVSGGGIEFMRPWTEKVYGVPPEQVIGSSIKTRVRDARRHADAVPPAGDQLHR